MHTLTQLHAELAEKIETNRKSGDKLRSQMVQDEAVMKMLDPEFNTRDLGQAPQCRQSMVQARDFYRAVLGALRTATEPMTADDICKSLLAGKSPEPTHEQENNLQAAILAALRKRRGKASLVKVCRSAGG